MTSELDELFRSFVESVPYPSAGRLDKVRESLDAEIEREISGIDTMANQRKVGRSSLRRRRRVALLAMVAATVVLVAVVVWPQSGKRPQVVRGSSSGVRSPWKLASNISQPAWLVAPGTGSYPYQVVCPSESTCYATGPLSPPSSSYETDVIEVSRDGGQSWHISVLPPDAIPLGRLSCLSADACVVPGVFDIVGQRDAAVMFTTDNGGQTWSSTPIGLFAGPVNLSCASISVCVATGSQVGPTDQNISASTTDGGQHWTESAIPGTFRGLGLQCTSGNVCIAVGQAPPVDSNQRAGSAAALYSTDGGATWNSGIVPSPGWSIDTVSCADGQHCMALEATNESRGIASVVIVTDDGGKTWSTTSSALSGPALLGSVSCATATDCWVSGATLPPDWSGGINVARFSGLIIATHDDGQTWLNEPVPTVNGLSLAQVESISCPLPTACTAISLGPSTSSQSGQLAVLSNRAFP